MCSLDKDVVDLTLELWKVKEKRKMYGESESVITLTELLKLKENGQFPDEPVKIEDVQIHIVYVQTYKQSQT